ncbi:MAG: Ion transport 2 domain protein [Caulobacteraceae bacterium]|nr:Ion transport 2 domain protein [Caulobacteraceae bacterium]
MQKTDGSPPAPPRLVRAGVFPFGHWRERYREAGLSVILALQATTIFVVSPLASVGWIRADAIEVLRFGLAATAILIVNRNRLIGACVAATFVVSLLCLLYLRSGAANLAIRETNIGVTVAFDLAVAWTVAHAAFDAGRVNVHRIMGAVILYLYIGLIFASLYRVSALWLHPSFSGLQTTRGANFGELIYFSFTTLTTAGFGDIIPVHPFMRSLTNLESVIGQLYPATFLARLVTLHGAAQREP